MHKRFRFKLEDFLSGKNIWQNYVFLDESQWWDKDKLEEYRLRKLSKLLLHCYNNVPAYRYLIGQAGLNPEKLQSTDEINKLPVINKQYILDHYNDFITINRGAIKGVKSGKTSGTTGQVLIFMNDANTRSMVWGSFLRFKDWMGYDFNNPYIVFRGRDFLGESVFSKLKIKLADLIENSKTLDSYSLGEREIQILIKLLNKYPKPIIRGYVLNIVDISTILKKMGLSYSIQAVSTTAEPLLDFHRKVIRDTFNCETFDQYGCGEAGGVAYECDKHQGLHVTEEHVIMETDANDEIILTDLDNYSFPFIRYKNGDRAILTQKSCSCGRKSQVIKTIEGRISDNIIGLNGLPVHWGYFHHLLMYSKIATNRNLIKFQVIQNKKSEIIFNIKSDPLMQSEKDFLSSQIKEKFGPVTIEVNNVDNISNDETGKFKAIISKIRS